MKMRERAERKRQGDPEMKERETRMEEERGERQKEING